MARIRKGLKKWRRHLLQKFGYKLVRMDKLEVNFESVLYQALRRSGDFFFVQIGANDGDDYIFEFVMHNRDKVAGIVIEPLKDIFNELSYKYRKLSKITPVNVQFTTRKVKCYFTGLLPKKLEDLPRWLKGILSFNENHHKLTNTPPSWITSEKVPCLSVNELLNKY